MRIVVAQIVVARIVVVVAQIGVAPIVVAQQQFAQQQSALLRELLSRKVLLRNNNSCNNNSCVQRWLLIVPQQQFASMAVMHGHSNGAHHEFVQYVSRGYEIPYANSSAIPRTRMHVTTLRGRWTVTSRGVWGGYD